MKTVALPTRLKLSELAINFHQWEATCGHSSDKALKSEIPYTRSISVPPQLLFLFRLLLLGTLYNL